MTFFPPRPSGASETWCTGGHSPCRRNAAVPTLAELERKFADVIGAFDRCIAQAEKNASSGWLGWVSPIAGFAWDSIGRQQTETSRNDRRHLLEKWAASKTDAERFEILKLAERWYEATRFGLKDCKGVIPTLPSAMGEQVKEYAEVVADAAKDAGTKAAGFVSDILGPLTRPLLYVGVGIGALVVLRSVMK